MKWVEKFNRLESGNYRILWINCRYKRGLDGLFSKEIYDYMVFLYNDDITPIEFYAMDSDIGKDKCMEYAQKHNRNLKLKELDV